MVCFLWRDRYGPGQWPAHAPIPRGEGAGLSAPAAAAKQEQLAQHHGPPYQAAGSRCSGTAREPKGAAPTGLTSEERARREGGASRAPGGERENRVALAGRAGLAVRMHIERLDLADADTIRDCFEVFLAAEQVDEPDGPWFTERPFRGWLRVGWGGDPREVWTARDLAGSVAGWYRLVLPDLE